MPVPPAFLQCAPPPGTPGTALGVHIAAAWDCRAVRTGHDDSLSVTLTLDGGGTPATLSGSFFGSAEQLEQDSLVAQAVLAHAVAAWAIGRAQANSFEGHVGPDGETLLQAAGPVSPSRDLVLDIQVPDHGSAAGRRCPDGAGGGAAAARL
jgi:hypothetical protein